MTKAELRLSLRHQLRSTPPEQLQAWSKAIVERIASDPRFALAKCVLLFHPLPDEPDITPLLRFSQQKTLLLPTVCGNDLQLHIYSGEQQLATGAFGIQESAGPEFTDYPAIDLALIPGVAFDAEGHRLGRGKGYYDRFLPRLTCPTIGICFPIQLVPQVPTAPHDIPVSDVITAKMTNEHDGTSLIVNY